MNSALKLVISAANIDFASDRLEETTMAMVGLDDGKQEKVGVFELTGIPAAHNEVDRVEQGRCKYLGFVVKFGLFCVYYSSDTLWHRDLVRCIAPD